VGTVYDSLIYLGAIVLAVTIGFFAAIYLGRMVAMDRDREWATLDTAAAHADEPAAAAKGAHR